MTPTLVGKQDVEILEVTGPRQLAVRPLSFSRHYERLQQQLRDEAQHLEKLIRVEPQQGCALYFENCWHRAMVEVSNNTSVEVRLVDLGRKTIASVDKLKKLPNHFLEDHAYCLLCHLPGCVDDDGSILETQLAGRKRVSLHRRGAPEMKGGAWSLPVEISWQEPLYFDPVGPPVHRTIFLSQRVSHAMRVRGDHTLDSTLSLSEGET